MEITHAGTVFLLIRQTHNSSPRCLSFTLQDVSDQQAQWTLPLWVEVNHNKSYSEPENFNFNADGFCIELYWHKDFTTMVRIMFMTMVTKMGFWGVQLNRPIGIGTDVAATRCSWPHHLAPPPPRCCCCGLPACRVSGCGLTLRLALQLLDSCVAPPLPADLGASDLWLLPGSLLDEAVRGGYR